MPRFHPFNVCWRLLCSCSSAGSGAGCSASTAQVCAAPPPLPPSHHPTIPSQQSTSGCAGTQRRGQGAAQWLSGCLDRPDRDIKGPQRSPLCGGQGMGQTRSFFCVCQVYKAGDNELSGGQSTSLLVSAGLCVRAAPVLRAACSAELWGSAQRRSGDEFLQLTLELFLKGLPCDEGSRL